MFALETPSPENQVWTHRTAASLRRSPGWIDPQTLMRIQGLELRAKVVVEGFWTGIHRSPYHGFSVEFTEYRQYTPGDDPRYLDWKLYARSDRYYVKRFEDETNLHCWLLVDASRSMGYGSLGYSKADYAATLAATLAYFLALQRDAVGLVTFASTIAEYLPARFRPRHSRRLMVLLEKTPQGRGTDLGVPLEHMAELVNKPGLIVLLSDLFADLDRLDNNLARLRSRGHDVMVFQVLDPAETTFPFSSPAQFEDVESGKRVYIDPGSARQAYLERLAAHHAIVEGICRRLGIDYRRMVTSEPLDVALTDVLRARQKSGATRARGREAV